MNQEIDGRRVKVLPILAAKCDLPGFLKGKLYADMSNTKSFRESLPVLLERLGASPKGLIRNRSRKSLRDDVNDSWLPQFRKGLSSDDPGTLYRTLKDAPSWNAKEFVADARILSRVFDLTAKAQPTYIRLQALELIGHLSDPNFAYRIEPLLSDDDTHVRHKTIHCLSSLESEDSAIKVLQILRSSTDPAATAACLEFFSNVTLHDSATALSLSSICATIMRANPEDTGIELRIASVAVEQMGGNSEIAQPLVLSSLRSPNDLVCSEVLTGLPNISDFLWVPSAKERRELAEAILECSRRDNHLIVAKSWVVMLLLSDSISEFENHDRVW